MKLVGNLQCALLGRGAVPSPFPYHMSGGARFTGPRELVLVVHENIENAINYSYPMIGMFCLILKNEN